ncbi:uncharacterized protein [Anabrus simplex]|uniref:uncharacterized protein isoform X1 n=1 Tax=Anabrus simplex TaxID=316456 RepID=UPI0034DD2CD3
MGGMKEPGVIAYKFTRKELQNSLKYRFKSTPENKILELCLHRSMSKRKRKYHAALSFYHVATELRECVLRNLWSDAVHLMLIFLDAPRRLLPLIWQYCFKILLNHPSGGPEILEEFIQMTTGVTKPRELIQSLLTQLKYV